MGGKKKYIEMFGSFTEPFKSLSINPHSSSLDDLSRTLPNLEKSVENRSVRQG